MKRILLVEDDPDARSLMRHVMAESDPDYSLEEAASGDEALEKIWASLYDLIVLDHRLPGATGLQVLERMRKADVQTPVILVTGEKSAELAISSMRLGVADILLKDGAYQLELPVVAKSVLDRHDVGREIARTKEEYDFQGERLAQMGRIFSEVLHDLRNPLAIISTSLEAVRDAKDKEKALRLTLDLMLRNVERSRQIINSLLDFSRPKEFAVTSVDLRTLVSELVEQLRLKCERQKISLSFVATDSIPPVEMAAQHVKGALLNLLMNAVEAMPGGGSLTVRIAEALEQAAVRIEISDTGMGISQENQKRLFERYFTTKPNGTGLGLIMTFQTVRQHKGTIWACSTPGHGTTFTIVLPRRHLP